MSSELAPIVIFAFDRPEHLRITLEHLSRNKLADSSTLYILCDGPKPDSSDERKKRIQQVKEVADSRDWAGKVIVESSPVNRGLAKSILAGVTKIVNEYGKVIVLEDDLRIGEGFLTFMNSALNQYVDEDQVKQVSGFCFPFEVDDPTGSFFIPVTNTIGWGTWHRAWQEVDFEAKGYEVLKTDAAMMRRFNLDDSYKYSKILIGQLEQGKNDSWGILLWWSVFKNDGIVLYPGYSQIQHNDFGNQGVHKSNFDHYDMPDWSAEFRDFSFRDDVSVSAPEFSRMKRYIRTHTRTTLAGLIKKILARLGMR